MHEPTVLSHHPLFSWCEQDHKLFRKVHALQFLLTDNFRARGLLGASFIFDGHLLWIGGLLEEEMATIYSYLKVSPAAQLSACGHSGRTPFDATAAGRQVRETAGFAQQQAAQLSTTLSPSRRIPGMGTFTGSAPSSPTNGGVTVATVVEHASKRTSIMDKLSQTFKFKTTTTLGSPAEAPGPEPAVRTQGRILTVPKLVFDLSGSSSFGGSGSQKDGGGVEGPRGEASTPRGYISEDGKLVSFTSGSPSVASESPRACIACMLGDGASRLHGVGRRMAPAARGRSRRRGQGKAAPGAGCCGDAGLTEVPHCQEGLPTRRLCVYCTDRLTVLLSFAEASLPTVDVPGDAQPRSRYSVDRDVLVGLCAEVSDRGLA
jgi:hypothetical protein